MKILFIDPECPEPLNSSALDRRALGGTEGTLFRVAEGLSAKKAHGITIAQHNRSIAETMASGLRFVPFRYPRLTPIVDDPDLVVVLRQYKILPRMRQVYPRARLALWMHCYPGKRWGRAGSVIHRTDTTVLTVSDHLGQKMVTMLSRQLPPWRSDTLVRRIYNPIGDRSPLPGQPVDPDKLVYFSSPHKGLKEVVEKFRHVRQEFPAMRLYTAEPGYWRGPGRERAEGVIPLGALPPREIHQHVRTALCVFYPQTWFAETFGLVFAEANALGTPVLAHPLGAALEVLNAGGMGQLVDCSDPRTVVDTLRRWRSGQRPQVGAHPDFTLESVLQKWESIASGEPVAPLHSVDPSRRPVLVGMAA